MKDGKRSDMDYISGAGADSLPKRGGGRNIGPQGLPVIKAPGGRTRGEARNTGPQGLPLIKPPWGRITAINLNSGDHVWMKPNGQAPEYIRNHPAMKGIDLSQAGNPERAPLDRKST